MAKKIEININYIRPNSSLIYTLYSKNGEKIAKERTVLSADKIARIREKHGSILYADDAVELSVVPPYRLQIALNQARDLFDEAASTGKISKTSFRGLEQVVDEIISDLFSSDVDIIRLMKDMKSVDEYLYFHSVNVGLLSGAFARVMGYRQGDARQIALGGFLIDIGYMLQDRQYLEKKGELDVDERHTMMRHPQLGYEMLKAVQGIHPIVLQAVLFHHERFNDVGYFLMPYEKLPPSPKITGICDMFDSFTTSRPHRKAMDPVRALRVLLNSIGIHFDAALVTSFINNLGSSLNNGQSFYGTGDVCELNTRELALVREIGLKDLLKPRVLIFCRFEKKGKELSVNFLNKPAEVDLKEDERYVVKVVDNPDHLKLIYEKLGSQGLL